EDAAIALIAKTATRARPSALRLRVIFILPSCREDRSKTGRSRVHPEAHNGIAPPDLMLNSYRALFDCRSIGPAVCLRLPCKGRLRLLRARGSARSHERGGSTSSGHRI